MSFDPSSYLLFGVRYSGMDLTQAADWIIERASRGQSTSVSALAVHGLMTSVTQPELSRALEKVSLIVPDGQPIRWALNSFYHLNLKDRVYGPDLTVEVLKRASRQNMRVFLFGSTADTLNRLETAIQKKFPGVKLVGKQVDRFREASESEDQKDIETIVASKAQIVLVGRGCPRQEFWVSQHQDKIPAAMMAVGAAFDFLAGTKPQAPSWMQASGLEWFFRLCSEPRRLWKRYLTTNSRFIYTFFKHRYILRRP